MVWNSTLINHEVTYERLCILNVREDDFGIAFCGGFVLYGPHDIEGDDIVFHDKEDLLPFSRMIYSILLPIIVCFGTSSNILSALVMRTKDMR